MKNVFCAAILSMIYYFKYFISTLSYELDIIESMLEVSND